MLIFLPFIVCFHALLLFSLFLQLFLFRQPRFHLRPHTSFYRLHTVPDKTKCHSGCLRECQVLIVSYHELFVCCRIAKIDLMFYICKHIIVYGLRILSYVLHITDPMNYKSKKLTNYFGQVQTRAFLEYSFWDFKRISDSGCCMVDS